MPESGGAAPGRAVEELARSMRGALGSLRAAAETLEKYPGVEGAPRARLLAVIAEEAERLSDLVRSLEQTAAAAGVVASGAAATVADLATGLARRAESLGFEVAGGAPDPALAACGLGLPGAEALEAGAAFLAALRREMAVSRLALVLERVDRHLLLDLGWAPEPGDLARLVDWQGRTLDAPPADGAGRGLRPLARDHGGEAWFILDRDGAAAHVKILLPLAAATAVGVHPPNGWERPA